MWRVYVLVFSISLRDCLTGDVVKVSVNFEPIDGSFEAVRIHGTLQSRLSIDEEDAFIHPDVDGDFASCTIRREITTRYRNDLQINSNGWRGRSFCIQPGNYTYSCNFTSIIDSSSSQNNAIYRRQENETQISLFVGGGRKIMPTILLLNGSEKNVLRLTVTFPAEFNFEVIANSRPIRRDLLNSTKLIRRVYFEDTPPLFSNELGIVLGEYKHFQMTSSAVGDEIDIFSREGYARRLRIRNGGAVRISVHYLTDSLAKTAAMTASLMTSFIDFINAFWEIQPKLRDKLDVVLMPRRTIISTETGIFAESGLIVISEDNLPLCEDISIRDKSCEYSMLVQLSQAVLSGYIGCLTRLGPQTLSDVAFNSALKAVLAKRMLLRLGAISEAAMLPLEVELFHKYLNAAESSDGAKGSTSTFDGSSAKFEALLRMLEQQIGTVAFNSALRSYLRNNSGCDHLPAGIHNFVQIINRLGDGRRRAQRRFFEEVTGFIESFLQNHQKVPLLRLRRLAIAANRTDNGRTNGVVGRNDSDVNSGFTLIQVTQECLGEESRECSLANWTIPLLVRIVRRNNSRSLQRIIVAKGREEILLEDGPSTATILIDQSSYGFYRIYYEHLEDFLRVNQSSSSDQADIALLFDYLYFINRTGEGLSDLPMLLNSVRFQFSPSQGLMNEINDKFIDGPYLRLLAANDVELQTRLRCLYRNFPAASDGLLPPVNPDLGRFRCMLTVLGGSSDESTFPSSSNWNCGDLLLDGGMENGKVAEVASYISALSLHSGHMLTCRRLLEELKGCSISLERSTSPEGGNVAEPRPGNEDVCALNVVWENAFTSSRQCLLQLLPLAEKAGREAVLAFVTSMARGSRESQQLLEEVLIKDTGPARSTPNEPGGRGNVLLSEIVLGFVKWHSTVPEGEAKTSALLRQFSNKSQHYDGSILRILNRNDRLVRLNRKRFINLVDSIYCRNETQSQIDD